jgi:hypothetical protein
MGVCGQAAQHALAAVQLAEQLDAAIKEKETFRVREDTWASLEQWMKLSKKDSQGARATVMAG